MENIIFSSKLTDAFWRPICYVKVFQEESKTIASYKSAGKKCEVEYLSEDVVAEIIELIRTHEKIFEYGQYGLEEPIGILDGVVNTLEFAIPNEKYVKFRTNNLDSVRDENAEFSRNWNEAKSIEEFYEKVTPVKAREVVELFDEIAAVLINNGVSSDCLRLGD